MTPESIKVCYIVSYRDPDYIRTRTLMAALQLLEHVELSAARNTRRGLLRYIETIVKLARIRFTDNPDVYLLGFRGHEIFWPVRLITYGKTLIFDSFVSPSTSLVEESKHGAAGRVVGRIVRYIELSILRASDYLLTDTQLHKQLFVEKFGVPESSMRHIYVGADPITPRPGINLESNVSVSSTAISDGPSTVRTVDEPQRERASLSVLFYGTFLPLHGIDVILDAARLMVGRPVHFTIVGGDETKFRRLNNGESSADARNITYFPWLEFHELRDRYIPAADICLGGPFGGTPQALRVISGKTFQFLALGKVTVIGEIQEDLGLVDRVNCLLVPQNNPQALVDTLDWMLDHPQLMEEIGINARKLYGTKFDIPKIAEELGEILEQVR